MKHKRPKLSATAQRIAAMDWFAKAQRAAHLCLPEDTMILQIAVRKGESPRFGGNIQDIETVARLLSVASEMLRARASEIDAQMLNAQAQSAAAEKMRNTIDTIGAKL